jgi:hypothetical protein
VRRLLLSCLLVSPCFHPPHLLYGQEGRAPLEPGERIRVYAPSEYRERVVGSIWSMEHDAILVKNETNTTWRIAYPTITRLEVAAGQKSDWLMGGVVGVLLGGALGGTGTYLVCQSLDVGFGTPTSAETEAACRSDAVKGLIAGSVGGAIIGMGIGSLIKTERWEEVPLERLRLQPVATFDGRVGLAVSLRF